MKTKEEIAYALDTAVTAMLGIVGTAVFSAGIIIACSGFLDLMDANPIAAGGVFLADVAVVRFVSRYKKLSQQDKNRSHERKRDEIDYEQKRDEIDYERNELPCRAIVGDYIGGNYSPGRINIGEHLDTYIAAMGAIHRGRQIIVLANNEKDTETISSELSGICGKDIGYMIYEVPTRKLTESQKRELFKIRQNHLN